VTGARPPYTSDVQVTDRGCKCKSDSVCGADVGTRLAACDWCRTQDSCGRWDIGGHWDFCVYPTQTEYEAQSATDKLNQLWENITDVNVVGKSSPVKSITGTLSQMLTESMITSFDDHMEVMPKSRTKVIHTQGVNCQFNLEVSSAAFTGVLEKGNSSGIIRMGNAQDLGSDGKEGPHPHGTPMFPGFGIKFLRSGVKSADWVALRTTGPGGSWNYFDSVMANHVAPPPELVALQKFQQASGCIDMVGLSDACTYNSAGARAASPVFPFQVLFEPTHKVNFTDKLKTNEDLINELSSIPVGSHIFDVYAEASPKDHKDGKRVLLGPLTTISPCYASLFGDEHMFFRHQRMEEDFALAPEWIDQMQDLDDQYCTASAGPISKWQCVPAPDNATRTPD